MTVTQSTTYAYPKLIDVFPPCPNGMCIDLIHLIFANCCSTYDFVNISRVSRSWHACIHHPAMQLRITYILQELKIIPRQSDVIIPPLKKLKLIPDDPRITNITHIDSWVLLKCAHDSCYKIYINISNQLSTEISKIKDIVEKVQKRVKLYLPFTSVEIVIDSAKKLHEFDCFKYVKSKSIIDDLVMHLSGNQLSTLQGVLPHPRWFPSGPCLSKIVCIISDFNFKSSDTKNLFNILRHEKLWTTSFCNLYFDFINTSDNYNNSFIDSFKAWDLYPFNYIDLTSNSENEDEGSVEEPLLKKQKILPKKLND